MLEAGLLVMGGLLASSHCVGMCGGFALTLGGASPRWRTNLVRQIVYCLGRVSTYTVAGALAGYFGWRLGQELVELMPMQAILSLAAGTLLIVQGLFTLGIVRRRHRHHAAGGCATASAFATLLRARHLGTVFIAGILNGFLPCGLVYAYLALAGASAGLLAGALTMALFGAGTIPALVLTGIGGSLLGLAARQKLFRLAALCLLLTGAITFGRGVTFLTAPEPQCPACQISSGEMPPSPGTNEVSP